MTAQGKAGLRIPFVGIAPSHGPIKEDVLARIDALVDGSGFANCSAVAQVLVDVAGTDHNLDPAVVEAATGPRTRFLLPVHAYSRLADMQAQATIAEHHDLGIVEDACRAHGAVRGGVSAGERGRRALVGAGAVTRNVAAPTLSRASLGGP